MAEHGHKIVYLIVERGANGNKKTYWRPLGAAYPCRDGSFNVKLDIHPGLTFNIRDPKSLGEREETHAGNQSEDLPDNSLGNSFENDFSEPFNDETFICNDCRQEKPNDEAYAVYNGERSARIAALKAINPAADANTTFQNQSGELIARNAVAAPSAKEAKDDLEVN
jgi:hypothetical protein